MSMDTFPTGGDAAAGDLMTPDDAQLAAISQPGPLFVVGAPGTGKTWVARQRVRRLLTGPHANTEAVLWCKNRHDSSAARDWLVKATGLSLSRPVALTAHSWAYAVLRRHAAHLGQVAPVLISGPEQDARLGELLQGHAAGDGRPPEWPEDLMAALTCSGFRSELRELLGRCAELNVTPEELVQWGAECGRPEWQAAGQVFAEYLETTALSGVPAYDQGALLSSAEQVLLSCDQCATDAASMQDLVVDDAQELTAAAVRLVKWLANAGVNVCLIGDSDVATLGFRGADPGRWFDSAAWLPAGSSRQVVVLQTSWRMGPSATSLYSTLVQRLGASAGIGHRAPAADDSADMAAGQVMTYAAPSVRHEMSYVAAVFRRARRRGAKWSELAVVVRAGSSLGAVRRHLVAQGIPVAAAVDHTPMRSQPVVHVLRALSYLVLDPKQVTAEHVKHVLLTVATNFDSWRQHHVVEFVRHWLATKPELLGQYPKASAVPEDEALRLAVVHAAELPDVPAVADIRQVADVVRMGKAAHKAAKGQADRVLWALWDATGLAGALRDQALFGGRTGERADEHLDAAMALFDAAGRFVGAKPGATLDSFWRHVDQLTLASDTLAARGNPNPGVALLTPAAAAGGQYHTVVVWGVHEGLWPNPTLRDTLLAGGALSDVVSGRTTPAHAGGRDWQAARQSVFADELRMFLVACTRATHDVVVTCVVDEESSGSEFFAAVQRFELAAQEKPTPPENAVLHTPAPSLLVARCRQRATELVEATAPIPNARVEYEVLVKQLARLAQARLPGAHPAQWALPMTATPWQRVADDTTVTLSPSAVETTIACPLRWYLRTNGFGDQSHLAAQIGTLVHQVAAALPHGTADELLAELDRRWQDLQLPNSWWAIAERRRVESMLTKWARHVAASPRDVLGVELPFEAVVDGVRVRGQIDRLERDADGNLVVVDLKTQKVAPRKQDVQRHAQLAVYQLGVAHGKPTQTTGDVAGAELVLVGTSTKSAVTRSQDALAQMADPDWAYHMVQEAAGIAGGGAFPARPGPDCDRCEFAASCLARSASALYPHGTVPTLLGGQE